MAIGQNTPPNKGNVHTNAPMDTTRPTHILTADLLVCDELITLPAPQDLLNVSASQRDKYAKLDALLKELFAKKGMRYGEKFSIDAEEFKALSVAVAGLPGTMEPGGATADTLSTVKHLLGDKVNIDFIGIAGRDEQKDNLITEDLRKSGITLDPGPTEGARAAMSFIFTHPDGKRTNITYPGNAAEKLKAEMITDAKIAKSDTILLPISLWSKFDSSLPETLLEKSWQQDKKIIVTLPKQARFAYGGPEDIYKKVLPRADVIVGDEEELARLYKTGGDYEQAIHYLQADLTSHNAVRTQSGKAFRATPATALIKHKNDSVTVLVAATPPGIIPAISAQRYEIAAPPSLSGTKHTLGVDDAIYAGFIAALNKNMPPHKAAEFAMSVAQTKFLYNNVRIPSPEGADTITQERWKNLRSSLSDRLAEVGSAISYAQTGVGNPVDQNLPRTRGQKAFDFILYPLIANIGVWALSMYVTYHSNFNQNKSNPFVKRSSWFKDQLTKIPGLGENPIMVRNLNMIIWSFLDGTVMAPVVAFFESKRQTVSRWLDDRMGTTPEDKSIYDQEIKRSWWDVIKARGATFALVLATYFTLNAKLFSNSKHEGILTETSQVSGTFKRETVESVNGFVFDIPAKKIGGLLTRIPFIRNFAQRTSDSQLHKMAQKLGTTARAATSVDARYQIEGVVNTGLFELVYTSLCTAGLFFIGKSFAAKRKDKQNRFEKENRNSSGSDSVSSDEIQSKNAEKLWSNTTVSRPPIEKFTTHISAVEKRQTATAQTIS